MNKKNNVLTQIVACIGVLALITVVIDYIKRIACKIDRYFMHVSEFIIKEIKKDINNATEEIIDDYDDIDDSISTIKSAIIKKNDKDTMSNAEFRDVLFSHLQKLNHLCDHITNLDKKVSRLAKIDKKVDRLDKKYKSQQGSFLDMLDECKEELSSCNKKIDSLEEELNTPLDDELIEQILKEEAELNFEKEENGEPIIHKPDPTQPLELDL